ncbi:MAG: ester cyclase [Halovenus sp.]
MEVEALLAEGNKVVQRSRQTGTHEGAYIDIEPTGHTVDSPGFVLYQIEDGQIVEAWVQANMMEMLQQLGVIEPPGE